MIDLTLGTFANAPTNAHDALLTLDALAATAERLAAIGPVRGPWTVARDVWDALDKAGARTADVHLDARLPPGTYHEGKPGAPRLSRGAAR